MTQTFQQQCQHFQDKAFNVAIALPEHRLQALQNQIDAALLNGESYAEFQRRLSKAAPL